MVDFSNSELYINKNKLKNAGAIALIEGILESKDCSMISEINLSYNYLTSECLPTFSRLNDPNFVQIQSLNLSYNDLGPDSMSMLSPMFSTLVHLNLSNTKLNNQSINDFVEQFKLQNIRIEDLDIHSNQVTTEGFYNLMVCLKTNNKVKKLNISKN